MKVHDSKSRAIPMLIVMSMGAATELISCSSTSMELLCMTRHDITYRDVSAYGPRRQVIVERTLFSATEAQSCRGMLS